MTNVNLNQFDDEHAALERVREAVCAFHDLLKNARDFLKGLNADIGTLSPRQLQELLEMLGESDEGSLTIKIGVHPDYLAS